MTETSPASPPPETLLVERRGRVAIVTLNRPEFINAFDDSIRRGLPPALAELERDPAIAAIVLTGAGERGFCVGADIKEQRAVGSPAEERRRLQELAWIESLDRVSKPVIAAIHGFCLGGGAELALACDIRVAARDSQFGLPETALGLIPGGGGTQRLPRLIGLGRALDLLLTGDRIGAEEAFRVGLVTRLAPSRQDALAEALRLAEHIADRPPLATAYAKEAAKSGLDLDLAAGLTLEKTLFALLTSTADRVEAAAAFREKRPPRFAGN
jgi:enoyl-CoA hydratase/carnithine racemase